MLKKVPRKKEVVKEKAKISKPPAKAPPPEVAKPAVLPATVTAPPPDVPRGTSVAPGESVLFCPRAGKWRDAVVSQALADQRINLTLDGSLVENVPFGKGVRCWKFRGV